MPRKTENFDANCQYSRVEFHNFTSKLMELILRCFHKRNMSVLQSAPITTWSSSSTLLPNVVTWNHLNNLWVRHPLPTPPVSSSLPLTLALVFQILPLHRNIPQVSKPSRSQINTNHLDLPAEPLLSLREYPVFAHPCLK